jgi:hypothetical protein
VAESAPLLRVYRVKSIEGSNPSLSAMLVRVLLALGLSIFLTACDGEKVREIEWQLPLSVPNDPHASSEGNELPDWAELMQGKAKVVFLQKSTARLFAVEIENGSVKELGDWHIQLQGLALGLRVKDHTFINDEQVPNPAAFITLRQNGALMYKGWLYQDFPELFGMDNSDWKVWVEDVTVPPSSQEDDNMLP